MKKVLAFDVDQTLNVAKTPIASEMAELLTKLLDNYEVAAISGQKFDQFLVQIVNQLTSATPEQLTHLHLFVTQGTRYYRYNLENRDWDLVYKFDLTDEQVIKMTNALETASRELDYWVDLTNGDEVIENRISQVTYSALGQTAGTEEKYAWDPDHKKRSAIIERAKQLAPEFDYEIGGTTSINATLPGTNKTFGMKKLLEQLNVTMDEVLYFGDMTQPGGNDYPVVEMGFETITVRDWQETANVLREILTTN